VNPKLLEDIMHPNPKLCRLVGSSPWITSLVLSDPKTPRKYPKEIETMFSKKIWLAAVALAPVLLFGTSPATAQDSTHCFDLASLHGKYGIVVTYLPTFAAAAIGTRSYDGAGHMTGTFIVNGPTAGSTTGARTITKGTQVGTYTVNCDGTGVITRTVTLATGQIETFVDDFVTTAAVRSWGDVLIATTISDVAENPTTAGAAPAGLYQTRVQTRLPNQ
jgi:hypothetical protein